MLVEKRGEKRVVFAASNVKWWLRDSREETATINYGKGDVGGSRGLMDEDIVRRGSVDGLQGFTRLNRDCGNKVGGRVHDWEREKEEYYSRGRGTSTKKRSL